MMEDFQSQWFKQKFVETLRQIDSSMDSELRKEVVLMIMRRLSSFVDDLRDLESGCSMNPAMCHSLFGRIKTENGYMDLLLNIYVEGECRLRQRMVAEYVRVGCELLNELKQLGLDDSESESGDEDGAETEAEASGGATN